MRTTYTVRQHPLWFIVSFAIALTFALAACGTPTGTGSSPTPAPTTVAGYGTANGCPSDAVVPTTPAANVKVTPNEHNSIISAQNGEVIEFDFPFGHMWSGPNTSQGALALQTPAGYASKANNVCVWRFTVQGSGTTQLSFTGRPICKKGQLCPQYIMSLPFTISTK